MAEKAQTPSTPATKAVIGDHDRVVMASRKADGTPDQTPDFTYIGDKAATLEATKQQLAEQAVSAVDVAKRGVGGSGTAGGSEPDAVVQDIKDAHETAVGLAERAAQSEVDDRFEKV